MNSTQVSCHTINRMAKRDKAEIQILYTPIILTFQLRMLDSVEM